MLRYMEIRQKILDDFAHQKPNYCIPSRKQLCETYQVSRSTVDRAVGSLIMDGLLYSVPGGGTYVADLVSNGMTVYHGAQNVGVLLPNILHDTYPGIIRGVQDCLQARQVNAVICNTDNDSNRQHAIIWRLQSTKIDGLILVPAIVPGESLSDAQLQELRNLRVPLVLCNRSIPGLSAPVVCSNNYYGGYLATRHLFEAGYRRIAHLGAQHYQTSIARYHGYMAAHWEMGQQVDERLVRRMLKEEPLQAGYLLTQALLGEGLGVDAIFCFNDRLACGAINAIHDAGLRVSQDIGIIGYDDTSLCEVPRVQLTSVSFKNYDIGYHAARLLLEMMAEPGVRVAPETVFRPDIHLRQSCLGPGNGSHPLTAR